MNGLIYDETRRALTLQETVEVKRVRIVVPLKSIYDEMKGATAVATRRDGNTNDLAEILGAGTARLKGGWGKGPRGRVLIEEID